MSSSTPFVLATGLDADLTVLEASAGTGKTFALAALSTFAIGRGDAAVGELCVATFTDAATAELRGRLRERIAQAITFLADERAPADELEMIMADLSADERAEWSARLRTGLRDFDTASITTIHGFCSRVVSAVAGLGIGTTLTADADDIDEVVRDVLLGRLTDDGALDIDYERLLAAVRLPLALPDASLDLVGPDDPEFSADDPAHVIRAAEMEEVAAVIAQCADEVHRRRAARQVRTFDDLLADTRDLLLSDDGRAVALELRRRFRVVLVDEFQDTDQVQWDILRTAFLDPLDDARATRMVVVGDPKQSIYRFRSAELSAYLAARAHAVATGGALASLTTNHRTDQPLLEALNTVFDGFTFGNDDIRYLEVTSPDPTGGSGIRGCGEAVLEFRSPDPSITKADDLRDAIAADLCDVVVDLLNGPERLEAATGEWKRLTPSDIGILVGRNADALSLAAALRARNVPAVASSSDSVLASDAATQWRDLLAALDRPTSGGAVRRAALSWFDGLDATELAALDEPGRADDLAALFDRYRDWSRLLVDRGLPALSSAVRAHGLSKRVLSRRGGERDLTDLEHIAELLQSRTSGRSTTAATLLEILDELADASKDESSAELYDRRIDRDDDTVRIMTVHKAKGLEFEVVLVPSMWNARKNDRTSIAHAAFDDGRRIDVDFVVGPKDPVVFDRVHRRAIEEDEGEDRRKLYVALTRAKSRLVVWYPKAYTWSGGRRVAIRDLLCAAAGTTVKGFDPSGLLAKADGRIAFIDAPAAAHGTSLDPIERSERVLETATPPAIDRTWKRWSFTGFTREMDAEHSMLPVPLVAGGFDEPSVTEDDGVEHPVTSSLPLRSAPGGTVFGSLVHGVLERVDFAAPDGELERQLRDECGRALRYQSLRGIDPDRLAEGLAVALRAPLGGPLGARALTHLATTDRLDELGFDLPLDRFDLAELAVAVLPHLTADDDFRPWFEAATERHLSVEGVLNGSIDLVARTRLDDRTVYWLADYKTNVIADGIDFDHIDLVGEMLRDDYVLQSTIYQVALHRFLRWRLGDAHDPATDLLGSAYLFVRGMDPGRPADDTRGVLWWSLPVPALEALDELFTPGRRGAAA